MPPTEGKHPGQPFVVPMDEFLRDFSVATEEDIAAFRGETEPKPKTPEVVEGRISTERAKEILGRDFLGAEAVENTFGFLPKEVPPIPYTETDLEKAKEHGEMLILRVSHDGNGNPLSMNGIRAITEQKLQSSGDGKLFFNTDRYENEHFFLIDTPKVEWKLVGTNFVPDSTSKNYIEQTKKLRDHLDQLGSLTPEELQECSDTFLAEITELMETDWEAAAIKLSELQINKNHRRTPVEILYDWIVRFKNTSKDHGILKQNYDWSNRLSSFGELVRVGYAGADGMGVRWCEPDGKGDNIGTVSVR